MNQKTNFSNLNKASSNTQSGSLRNTIYSLRGDVNPEVRAAQLRMEAIRRETIQNQERSRANNNQSTRNQR